MLMCAVTVFFMHKGELAHASLQVPTPSRKELYKGKKILAADGKTELTIDKVEECWKIGRVRKK